MTAWIRRRLCSFRWWRHHCVEVTGRELHRRRHHINGALIVSIIFGCLTDGAKMLDVMFVALAVVSEF